MGWWGGGEMGRKLHPISLLPLIPAPLREWGPRVPHLLLKFCPPILGEKRPFHRDLGDWFGKSKGTCLNPLF